MYTYGRVYLIKTENFFKDFKEKKIKCWTFRI